MNLLTMIFEFESTSALALLRGDESLQYVKSPAGGGRGQVRRPELTGSVGSNKKCGTQLGFLDLECSVYPTQGCSIGDAELGCAVQT